MRWRVAAALAILPLLALALTGCTAPLSGSASGSLQISPGTITFGAVTVGSTSTADVSLVNQGSAPVQVSSLSVTGDAFSLDSSASFPFTVAANGGTYTVSVKFNPVASGSASGQLTLTSNLATDATRRIGLIGTGTLTRNPTLSGLTCTYAVMAPGTDPCSVSLSSAAPTGGITVSLSSNNAAVTVPASVTIPAGATSASFSAIVSAASGSQKVVLSASAGGKPESFDLQIEVAAPAMSLSATNLAFGTSPINTPVAQVLTLTSTGAAAITISSATPAGTGFSVSGASLPVTLTPGQTTTLTVQFDPTTAGAATGQLTLTSDAASGSTTTIPLTGNGQPTISAFSCTTSSFLGAGTDACTVTLNAVAASGGFAVNLSSSNSAVTVPATVTVAAGASSASFSAAVSSVTSSQTAILTANAGGTPSTFDVQLGAGVPTLSLGSSSLSFGSVAVSTATSQLVTLNSTGTASVVISSASITGSGFTISGATFPLTIGANQSASLTVQFDPTLAGSTSGQLTLISNSSTGSSTVALSGTGVPVLTSLSCASSSMTGSGTDTCTVALNAAAPSGGLIVVLSSNNSAVTVPASVTVAAGSASAGFSATVASVSTAQTVTLSSNAGSISKTFALQLNAALATLSVNATSIAFGDVSLNTPATQTVTLTSTGALPVTVSSVTISGTGFSLSGTTSDLTLNTNQTATVSIVFDPTVSGAATGQLTIVSNSSANATDVIPVTGTGQTTYQVKLTWDAPTSSADAVAGYNVYRSPSGASDYTLVTSVSNSTLLYMDTSSVLTDGQVYDYIVESVDASGNDSVPSNTAVVTIPTS